MPTAGPRSSARSSGRTFCASRQDDRYPAHFIGSVVYIEHGLYQATAIPQLLVIDGQQRLTTVTLMIEALARALESQGQSVSGEITDRKLRNYFLFNPEEDGDLRYKLQLSKGDVDTLRAILERKALPEHPVASPGRQLRVLPGAARGCLRLRRKRLYRGLSKLLVVDVALDRDHDNPQLIFESLNSTGLDLSQSDLIRNFVLMGLEPAQQEELYQDHWRPMEQTLGRSGRDDVFDRFLRAWLTLRLGEVPNIRRGYETFKRYRAMNLDRPISELVADLHRCAEHYACIALGQESHPDLARAFGGLQALRIDAPMPFLMHAYALWKDRHGPRGRHGPDCAPHGELALPSRRVRHPEQRAEPHLRDAAGSTGRRKAAGEPRRLPVAAHWAGSVFRRTRSFALLLCPGTSTSSSIGNTA